MTSIWSTIILEGYCTYSFNHQKKWIGYEMKFNKKKELIKGKKHVSENKNYIPASERPGWCKKLNKKRAPQFRCLCNRNKQCPFFGFTNASKQDYIKLYSSYISEGQ